MYAVSDGIMKFLVPVYGVHQIAFLRTFFRFVPFCFLALYLRTNPLKTSHIGENILRAILASCATYGFIAAYKFSPMTDVIVIAYTSSIFVLPLSVLILKEKFTAQNLIAVLLGFGGVILIFYPGCPMSHTSQIIDTMQFGLIFALIASLSTALNHVIIRRLALTDSELTIIFYHHLCLLITSLCFGKVEFHHISTKYLGLILIGGLLGAMAQYCTIHAHKLLKCVDLAPITYLIFIPAIAIDYFFYGYFLNFRTIAGALCIIVGCWSATLHRKIYP